MADASLTVSINGQDNLSGELKKIESGVIRFVGAVSAALATLSTVGFPVVSAANFQKELLNAAKTTNYTRDQIGELRGGLDELSKQSNITAIDFAKIATLGGQLGIGENDVSALLEFTKQIGIAITALDIPAEEAVDSIGKLINIFNVPASQYKNLISSLNEVSNSSTATATQLFDVVRRIGNLGGSVDIPAAAAISASMIDLGLTAETAGTTITKIFADMKSNAADFANVAVKSIEEVNGQTQIMRYSTEEWVRLVATDGLTALKAYATGLNQLGASQAAQVKSQLTGEGRLFEAVTKLQQQQLRQASIQDALKEAERSLAATKAQGTNATEAQIAAEQQRVDALKAAVTQANVLDRLNTKAQQAFASADSAVREQQTTLAGLIAQWSRFQNNLISLVNSVGGQLLGPLTDSLRGMSDSLQSGLAGAQLQVAAQEIVGAIQRIGDAFAYLRTFTDGIVAVDWGGILRIGALLAAFGVLKGLGVIFGYIGSSAASAVPGLTALRKALFGVSEAEAALAAAQEKRAQRNTLQGGILESAKNAINAQADAYVGAVNKLAAARDKAINVAARAQAALPAAQQALAASFAALPRYITSVGDAQQRLAQYTANYNAAIASGNTRAASGYRSQIVSLERMLLAIRNNQAAVTALTNQLALAQRIQVRSTDQLDRLSVPFRPQLTGLADAARNAATTFKTEFGLAMAGGGSVLTSFIAALNATAAPALRAGATAGRGFATGFKTQLASLAGAAGGAVLKGLGLEGFGDKFNEAATRTTKSIVVLQGGFTALGSIIRLVGGLLSRAVGFVFFAMMAKELLDMVGLWDKLLEKVVKVAKWMGFTDEQIPDFLKPKVQVEATAAAAQRLADRMATAREEATKFTDTQKASLAVLTNSSLIAQRDIKFDRNDPGKSSQAQKDYLEALTLGFSKAEVAATAYAEVQRQLVEEEKIAEKSSADLAKAKGRYSRTIKEVTDAETALAAVRAGGGDAKAESAAVSRLAAAQKAYERARRATFADLERSATEATGKVNELRGSSEALKAQIEQVGGTAADPYAGLYRGAENYIQAVFTAEEATALFTSAIEGQDAPMVRYTESLLKQRQAATELADADKRLKEQQDTKGRSESSIVALEAAYEAAKTKADTTSKATAAVRDEVTKLGRSRTQVEQFLNAFDTRNPDALVRNLVAMTQAARTLPADAFKGLGVPEVKADDLLSAASIVAVKTRVKSMYDSWAAAADTAAERAKNAVTTAMADVQKLMRDAQATAEKITQAYANSKNKATRQTEDRKDDAASRQRLRDIQTEYDTERALLEQMFSVEKNRFAEQEAGGLRISDQKQQMYAMEQQALFALEEKYNKLKEAEQDRVNIGKAKRGVQDEIKQFDELIKKIDYYKKRVTEANNVLLDPSAGLDKKAGAIEQRNLALDKMKAIYGQLEAAGERIANTEPIGGQLLITPDQINKINQSLTGVADTIGKVGVEGADKIEPVFKALATNFSNVSGTLSKEIEVASQAFAKLSGTSGPELDALAAKYAALVAQSSNYAAGLEKIQELSQKGLSIPGSIKAEDITAISDSISKAISAAGDKTPINLSVNQESLAGNIANAIRAAASTGAIPTPITVTASGESLTALQSQIQENVKPKLKGEIEITKIRGANGQLTVTYNPEQRARGGFIGDIARYATGGRVRGAGDGTSDSILSWLSNGEYVMDALTTSRFGPKFFASLQQAARGGYSLNMLRGLQMPKFATGGPIGIDTSAFAGIANDFKSSIGGAPARDVVDINLSSGGQRATIQAEREQAKNLVSILSQFGKGK